MNAREQGFLLLTGYLGNPQRRPLTAAQLRTLTARVRTMENPIQDRELTLSDLTALGYGPNMAGRILGLLEERELLDLYLQRGAKAGCVPVTRVSAAYPPRLRSRLGGEASGCLWAKGELALLQRQGVALVGSRDLRQENRAFAREAGIQAARQGYVLISGNARGADREAQESCLKAGGAVISVVADELFRQETRPGVLYLSEEGFDLPFTSQRAHSRNRVIHCLGKVVLVAQASLQTGGTWAGTARNLRFGWNSVCCYDDGSQAVRILEQMGAVPIGIPELSDLDHLPKFSDNLFDQ